MATSKIKRLISPRRYMLEDDTEWEIPGEFASAQEGCQVFTAFTAGIAGNAIELIFDGIKSVDEAIEEWNITEGHENNQVALAAGSGHVIFDIVTITLSGGENVVEDTIGNDIYSINCCGCLKILVNKADNTWTVLTDEQIEASTEYQEMHDAEQALKNISLWFPVIPNLASLHQQVSVAHAGNTLVETYIPDNCKELVSVEAIIKSDSAVNGKSIRMVTNSGKVGEAEDERTETDNAKVFNFVIGLNAIDLMSVFQNVTAKDHVGIIISNYTDMTVWVFGIKILYIPVGT